MLRLASGLYVPDAVVVRRREVWTRDEWKHVERSSKLFNQRKLLMLMRCGQPDCADPAIQGVEQPSGMILRCGCTDRVFDRGQPRG